MNNDMEDYMDLILVNLSEDQIFNLFEDFEEAALIRFRTVIDGILASKQGSFS